MRFACVVLLAAVVLCCCVSPKHVLYIIYITCAWSYLKLGSLQAEDGRFCNAGVEFDLASLRPTYRLIWGSVGASNALAVAEGLGFDPLVIAEARKVCHTTSLHAPLAL